ncbi:amidohydrolase [Alistipes provencensis]|uniref:amidohydrolase n=1 Tax=Alistipes provencensis TaxID=1816676 RepID=UPI0007EE179B|nr:amidohydrolase [Alistipes provencensis]
MAILFSNATVLPMTASGDESRTFTGAVGIDGDRIALVTASEADAAAFRAAHPGLREIDCRGKLLMPGLVNTHCHAAMTLQRSYADDISLMAWLHDYIWPFEAHQTPDDVKLGMTLGIVEMLLGGVTSFVDMYYFENRCVEVAERLGIRALLGCNYFDTNIDEVLPQAEEAVRLAAAGSGRVRIAVAPHSPYTVSPENLLRGKELADKHGLHLMTHISETQDEVRIVREKYGQTSVEHLDQLGLLGPKTIGAHCVHVTDSDIETLAARGVTVSHNPQSNMKISSGVAPVEKLRAAGALVTIGTDGTCSNNDLDMFEELRTAAFLQKSATGDPVALPAYETLRLATANGARAMGCADGELGVIREGALADVIVVDMQKPHLQPVHNVVSNVVYCGKASDVETVVVGGRIVVENRRIAGVDLPELYRGVAEAVARIKAKS